MTKRNFFFNTVIFLFIFAIIGLSGCKPGTPKADFGSDKTSGTVPLTVSFTDNSTVKKSLNLEVLNIQKDINIPALDKASVINQWSWNFGDGNTSSEKNSTHVYNTPGQYTVSLTVKTNSGKTDTATKTNYINAIASGTTEGEGTPEGTNEGTPEGTNEGEPGAGIYVWGTGDDWVEDLLSSTSVAVEQETGTPVSTNLKLHPLPEYSTESFLEHEASLYLTNYTAFVTGTLALLEYPKASGSPTSKVWHMVTNQYAVRLTPATKGCNGEKASPDSAGISIVVGSSSQIPAGFKPIADLYTWRKIKGKTYNANGTEVDSPSYWFNLTNGNANWIYTSGNSKATNIYQSIYYPVGNHFDCPLESPANYAAITTTETPKWRTDLENNNALDWLNPPPSAPANPPAGYRYEYQGRTVVVDKVTADCTLPGLNDPINPRDYNDEPTDCVLVNSSTTTSNFVCENDIIVTHTWKLVPNN